MRPLRIALGDLYFFNKHTRGYLTIPLNIGYLSRYVKMQAGRNVEIHLFKDPNQLLEYAQKASPEIVGLSFYFWNTMLNQVVTRRIRKLLGQDVVIIWGGPSVDTDKKEQERLFSRFPEVDAFIPNEGEMGFYNIVQKRLSGVSALWSSPIDGVVFRRNGMLIQGRNMESELDLKLLKSPYLEGDLSPFLSGNFQPVIQTSRGCPYTCVYCVSGKNKNKMRAFLTEQVKEEIDYICHYFVNRTHFTLILVDENFGIMEHDVEIAQYIRESSDKYQYPRSVYFYNNKGFTQNTQKILQDLSPISKDGLTLALQSENPETLKTIKRRNLTPEQIDEAISWASERNIAVTTEIIFGLPMETRETFIQMLNELAKHGFDTIGCFNLLMADGAEINRRACREKYGLITKFRRLGANYGYIGSDFCAETEEIVVSSKQFSFEDYLAIRKIGFMFHAVFVLGLYKYFFHYIRHLGVPLADYFYRFMTPEQSDMPRPYATFVNDYISAIKGELFDSSESMIKSLEEEVRRNQMEAIKPAARLNSLYGARLIYLERGWLPKIMRDVLNTFVPIEEEGIAEKIDFLLNLCALERIQLQNEQIPESIFTEYDVVAWRQNKFRYPIEQYRMPPQKLFFLKKPAVDLKIASFKKDFAEYEPLFFYYNAMDFILPRSNLLYDLSIP